MPEITDAQLAAYQKLGALVTKLESDPRSRPLIEQAVKIHHPEVRTQAEDLAAAAEPITAPILKELEELKTWRAEREASEATLAETRTTGELEASFKRLTDAGYTTDGLEKIKGLMVDRNIADPEAAAALFDKQNPKPSGEVPAWVPQHWDASTDHESPDIQALFKDEDKWADRQVGVVLAEERSKRAA